MCYYIAYRPPEPTQVQVRRSKELRYPFRFSPPPPCGLMRSSIPFFEAAAERFLYAKVSLYCSYRHLLQIPGRFASNKKVFKGLERLSISLLRPSTKPGEPMLD